MAIFTKLGNSELENIRQILTLRYSTNLGKPSKLQEPRDFYLKQFDNPKKLVEDSIRKHIRKEIGDNCSTVGVSLSSGIDSALALGLLRNEYPSIEIESLSVKFSNSEDETNASKKIAEKFKTTHHVLEINNFLEELPNAINIVKHPFWDLHWYYLVKKMKSLSDIFLSGDGGDELFGGYTFRYKKFLEQTTEHSTVDEKILTYLNCHERDWVHDQESIFGTNCLFSWDEIYDILKPYFDNSLPRLSQVFLADVNGKLRNNMLPLYSKIHKAFNIKNIAPIMNTELVKMSPHFSNDLKYNPEQNSGKIILTKLLKNLGIQNLVSLKKQGFSVNTIQLWTTYGKSIFHYYFDKSRLVEDKIINLNWLEQYSQKSKLDVRYVNKLLGLLALEIWYRLFITKEITSNEKLVI